MKKHWYFLIPAVIVLTPVLLALGYVVSYGYSWGEAFQCVRHFGECKTRYAQKFSESSLSRVQVGMTGDQVFNLIGGPMEGHVVDGKFSPVWRYSLPAGSAAYHHERTVHFATPANKPPVVKAIVRRLHGPEAASTVDALPTAH
jgi:hypothetical protein